MTNTFNELVSFIADMTEEVRGIKATIEYLEAYMLGEYPTVPEDIEQLKVELADASEALECGIAYRAKLAAY